MHVFARLCIRIQFSERKIFSNDIFQCKTSKSKSEGKQAHPSMLSGFPLRLDQKECTVYSEKEPAMSIFLVCHSLVVLKKVNKKIYW